MVELKSSLIKKYIFIPLALLVFYADYAHFVNIGFFNTINLYYTLIGILTLIICFEKELFGTLRYVKLQNGSLIYKRLPFSPKEEVLNSEISSITFKGSYIYVKTEQKEIAINLSLIAMTSRIAIKDLFDEHFKDIVTHEPQEDLFTKRYNRKMKRINERLNKQKNE